ncbi:MAG: hypothetical protein JRE71_07850, partial [Deltaproteobacteria bacterium]|nr:hypothetical protein [Deltaproteobacteria bacterium]
MSDSILDRRWPWLVAAAAIVVAYLYSTTNQIDGDIHGDNHGDIHGDNETRNKAADSRPVGSIEDVAKLRER